MPLNLHLLLLLKGMDLLQLEAPVTESFQPIAKVYICLGPQIFMGPPNSFFLSENCILDHFKEPQKENYILLILDKN